MTRYPFLVQTNSSHLRHVALLQVPSCHRVNRKSGNRAKVSSLLCALAVFSENYPTNYPKCLVPYNAPKGLFLGRQFCEANSGIPSQRIAIGATIAFSVAFGRNTPV